MSKLFNSANSYGFTENGALTLTTSNDYVLDLFSMGGALRGAKYNRLVNLVKQAFEQDSKKTLQVLFYLRDCRNGMGEKRVFQEALKYLVVNFEKNLNFQELYDVIKEIGYLKDVFKIFTAQEAGKIIKCEFYRQVETGEYDLLFKYLPSVGGSWNKYANRLAHELGLSPKDYRKTLTVARKKINIVESKICSQHYEEINYDHVPAKAGLMYSSLFRKHDKLRYEKYLEEIKSGEKKAKVTSIYPYELFFKSFSDEELAEELWKQLPDYTNGENALCMCDVSGSMSSPNNIPMAISVSLGLYFAERTQGYFHNEFMTFSEKPTFVTVKGNTLKEKINNMMRADWGYNTDLISAFGTLLNIAKENNVKEEDMPDVFYIISDMEFDRAVSGKTNLSEIKELYKESGYNFPRIVFWNANSRQNNLAANKDDKGIALVSGSSPVAFKMATDKGMTPLKFMNDCIEPYSVLADRVLNF